MKSNYCIIKKAISPELCSFLYNHLLLLDKRFLTLTHSRYISVFNSDYGTIQDGQVPGAFAIYSDPAFETLLVKIKPILEKTVNKKLIEAYSYARLYKIGNALNRHKDRYSCEFSCTLHLGGEKWPLFLEPSGKTNKKGVRVDLNPGDLLAYKGCDVEHWREPLRGELCGQVFLHYNKNDKKGRTNQYDKRAHLGLPVWFQNK
jgi:hypothetical protein